MRYNGYKFYSQFQQYRSFIVAVRLSLSSLVPQYSREERQLSFSPCHPPSTRPCHHCQIRMPFYILVRAVASYYPVLSLTLKTFSECSARDDPRSLLKNLENTGYLAFSPCKNMPDGRKIRPYDDRWGLLYFKLLSLFKQRASGSFLMKHVGTSPEFLIWVIEQSVEQGSVGQQEEFWIWCCE